MNSCHGIYRQRISIQFFPSSLPPRGCSLIDVEIILWRPTLGLDFGYRLSGFVWDKGVYQCHTSRGCEPLSLSGHLKCSFCTTITEPSIYLSYRHRNHGAPSEVARDNILLKPQIHFFQLNLL